ncbi:NudC domain-containing protein 1 [Borealophlyctis nickersoniae]|nr:NudC domain-containing protein 1 [Borealophlyctis nickersoniae]
MSLTSSNSQQVSSLHPDRNLLNAKFESYKLKLHHSLSSFKRHAIPVRVAASNVPHSTQYRKLEARSRFNHLFAAPRFPGCALYIDENYMIAFVTMNEESPKLGFRTVHQLPKPAASSDQLEFPSLYCTERYIVASNGAGTVELLDYQDPSTGGATVLVSTTIPDVTGLVIVSARFIPKIRRVLFLAYQTREREIEDPYGKKKPRVEFLLSLFSVPIDAEAAGSDPASVETLCTVIGYAVPFYASIEPYGEGFVVACSHPYEEIPPPREQSEPQVVGRKASLPEIIPEKPIEYKWMQTPEDITIAVRLPHPTLKKDIHCKFRKDSLLVEVRPPTEMTVFDHILFADIIPEECTWTLEDNRVLTLYLQKTSTQGRWMQLWDVDEKSDGVDETMDPSEMANIMERMEKYTSESEEYGWGGPMQNVGTERSEDVDFEGESVTFVRFSTLGTVTHVCNGGGHKWLGMVLPRDAKADEKNMGAVLLWSDVDGLVYDIEPGLRVTHTSTFDRFGYIQASKKAQRFLGATPDREFAFAVESLRNVFIYRRTKKGQTVADQILVDMEDYEKDEQPVDEYNSHVVGVQAVGKGRFAVLKEKSLVFIGLAEES